MRSIKGRSRGFTLIASLLVLALLSAIAVSLLFMVQGAGQVGNNDLETNRAYYGAESGMELLTANLAALYQQSQSPTPAQLTALGNNPPTSTMIGSMNYQESVTWIPDANGNPKASTSVISSGTNAGLTAEIVPLTLKVSATRPGGASVNMTRGVEVALIPVFQFGVFSDSDLSYFAGPNFNFAGRVHTNGNLFLAEGNGNNLVLDDKVTAVGEHSPRPSGQQLPHQCQLHRGCLCAQAEPRLRREHRHCNRQSELPKVHRAPGQLECWYPRRWHADLAPNLEEHFDEHIWGMDRQRQLAVGAAADPPVRAGGQRRGAADCDYP